ncbi:MAG: acyltransferase family protein [Nitrospira sp. CR1.2]|nr:acyltransferase family protein [Nitrospira sp. CR1.2]
MVLYTGMDVTSLWPAVGVVLLALGTAMLLPSVRPRQAPPATRYSSLDGLRGYLALAVFLSHSSIWYFYLRSGVWDVPPSTVYTQLGQSSVTLFFMITGFLFWSKLLNGRLEPIDWTRLYLSRLLRLGPLYLLAAACVILVAFCRAGFELKEPSTVVAGQVATWLMFTIPGVSPVNGFAETVPLAGAVWTLPYEWLFYACLPIGALCLRASIPLPWLAFSAGAVTALNMGMPEVRMPMLSAFAAGITAASLARIAAVRAMLARGVWGGIAIACFATTLCLLPTAYMLSAVLLLAIAFLIIACGNSLYGILEWPASVSLGEMAYSLYLLHGLVLFVAYRLVFAEGAGRFSPIEHWAIVLGLVPVLVLLCFATFRLIEKPAMDAVPRWHAWLTARFS